MVQLDSEKLSVGHYVAGFTLMDPDEKSPVEGIVCEIPGDGVISLLQKFPGEVRRVVCRLDSAVIFEDSVLGRDTFSWVTDWRNRHHDILTEFQNEDLNKIPRTQD